MASLVAERVGLGMAEHFCCTQRRPSPPSQLPELIGKKALASLTAIQLCCQVERFRLAVAARCRSLAVVDGFYRRFPELETIGRSRGELMTCQWRIEAIEAQQRALQALQDPSAGCEGLQAELQSLREAARRGIQERATHYAHESALGRYLQLVTRLHRSTSSLVSQADDVFGEASAEMQGLPKELRRVF